MCTAGDVARGNSARTQAEEGSEEDEEEEVVVGQIDNDDDDDFPQPETTMAQAAPPVWPPPGDVNEDEVVTEATQDDFQIGYLQISDDPAAQNASEEREGEDEEVANNSLPTETGALAERATNGHAGSLAGAVVSDGRNPLERIVTVNGMQFHVYGNVSGLELLGSNNPIREEDLDMPDSEEEEEEERRRAARERAIEEASAADAARRAAPIPPERRAMIVNAMKGINLGGFRPSWADSVPEDQWINKVKETSTSAPK